MFKVRIFNLAAETWTAAENERAERARRSKMWYADSDTAEPACAATPPFIAPTVPDKVVAESNRPGTPEICLVRLMLNSTIQSVSAQFRVEIATLHIKKLVSTMNCESCKATRPRKRPRNVKDVQENASGN